LLAASCSLIPKPEPVSARELIDSFDLAKLAREKWMFTDEHLRWLLAAA